MGKNINITSESAKAKVKELGGYKPAGRYFNIPESTLRRICKGTIKSKSVKRFVVTTAINDTPVHLPFYNSLMRYCSANNAELMVYRQTYRNPTSIFEAAIGDPKWASEILPFSIDSKRTLSDKIVVFTANVQPTAALPLSALESNTGNHSIIIPHPKQHYKSIPIFKGEPRKIALTTGAITVSNYSRSKAGSVGGFHHIIGAVIVEIEEDGSFHVRHISADDDGSFYDIAGHTLNKYTTHGIYRENQVPAMVFGDIHAPFHDQGAIDSALRLAKEIGAENIILHDIFDSFHASKHDQGDPYADYGRGVYGLLEVEKEIEVAANLLKYISDFDTRFKLSVVRSNHDQHLDTWLHNANTNELGINAKYFHWLSYNKYKSLVKTSSGFTYGNPLEFAISEKIDLEAHKIRFLKVDEPLRINGIELGQHGHYGANGSRGSVLGFSKLAVRSIIGHIHSPAMINGAIGVGVFCQTSLGYTHGPSSWGVAGAIVYPNSKRVLFSVVNGKCCL